MIFAVIFDDLIAFTCIPRIFEGSELVLLGAEVACTGFGSMNHHQNDWINSPIFLSFSSFWDASKLGVMGGFKYKFEILLIYIIIDPFFVWAYMRGRFYGA